MSVLGAVLRVIDQTWSDYGSLRYDRSLQGQTQHKLREGLCEARHRARVITCGVLLQRCTDVIKLMSTVKICTSAQLQVVGVLLLTAARQATALGEVGKGPNECYASRPAKLPITISYSTSSSSSATSFNFLVSFVVICESFVLRPPPGCSATPSIPNSI